MNQAFSKMMAATEGRFLTAIEEERAVAAGIELKQRATVSRLIEQVEFNIVDFATHAFCDIHPDFDGPKGSVRRKKGHQDGRIMLRYISQAVREGSAEIFFEKVLSWLIGHLDERNVTGQHMEVFVHFLHQGTRRELPAHLHGFFDPVFEQVIDFIRRASHSGTILRAHRRIAEFAVNRIMDIMPDVKAAYGVSSMPKCKRDFELLIKEVAKAMKAPSQEHMNEQFAGWLTDRLMNQVAYPHEVWHWSFLALREGIVHCCGAEAGAAVSELFETMADNSQRLVEAVEMATAAGDLSSVTADRLIEQGEPLGLLRKDEFRTAVSMVNRELITRLVVLNASVSPDAQTSHLAEIWNNEVLPKMPTRSTSFLASNLKALLENAKQSVSPAAAEGFRDAIMRLVAVARRVEIAERLAGIADDIASEVADWGFDTLGTSAKASRACFKDVRLAIARVVQLIPSGPSSVNGHEFRDYLARYVLPNDPATASVMEQTYRRIVEAINEHLPEEDARLARTYFEDSIGCFERNSKLRGIHRNLDNYAVSAVERGYQAAPRHESLARHGIEAGRRDGAFLLEKTILAAIVGGDQAENALHKYFINEQIRLSKLPGSVVVEFVRGLQEQVRDYPEVVELLVGLAKQAPAYTSSFKINERSQEIATFISKQAIESSPGYRERIGEHGLEACVRDNSVMVRGLAHYMAASPLDVMVFRDWWMRRIGKNIRNRPEASDASDLFSIINVSGLLHSLRDLLDEEELSYVSAYLNRVVNPEGDGSVRSSAFPSAAARAVSDFGITSPMSFADVGM